jgi:hypothetical protein
MITIKLNIIKSATHNLRTSMSSQKGMKTNIIEGHNYVQWRLLGARRLGVGDTDPGVLDEQGSALG